MLPIGAYLLTFQATGYDDQTVVIAVSLAGPTKVTVVMKVNLDQAVPPTVVVSDQLSVGYQAAVTVNAVATGTSPFTFAWTQESGLPVTLAGAASDTLSFTTPDFATSMGSTPTTTAAAFKYARFGALGINPDQAGHSTFKVTVTDANGLSTSASVEVDSTRPTTGLRSVALGIPVHLQGDCAFLLVPSTPVCAISADCPTATSTCTVATAACGCTTDADCGGATSGLICSVTKICKAGCYGTGGNACPGGLTCSSTTAAAGYCSGSQTSWAWTLDLTKAPGSAATLVGAATQFPSFTPDVKGTYLATETVSGKKLTIYGGTWLGAMTSDGSAPAATCGICHTGSTAPDVWSDWRSTLHASALQRDLEGSAGPRFGEACLSCHTVGYDKTASNNGFDDLEAASGWTFPTVPATPTPGNWSPLVSNTTLGPLAGIQCENCHGPQSQPTGGPHASSLGANPDVAARVSWSGDVCASCHQQGPAYYFPSQHDAPGTRFVGHSNRQIAIAEGAWEKMPATLVAATGAVIPQGNNLKHCSRCHAAQGFAQYAKQIGQGEYAFLTNDSKPLSGANHPATGLELKAKGLALATVEAQTCQACHDPHLNDPIAHPHQLRLYDSVPAIPNGMSNVTGLGTGAICIACHNGRQGEHSDFAQNTVDVATGRFLAQPTLVAFPTEHDAPQAEMLYGFSTYFTPRYGPSAHLAIADTCAGCHAKLATGGEAAAHQSSNHAFGVDNTSCANCHSAATDGQALQAANQVQIDSLRAQIAQKMLTPIVAAINNVPASGAMVVAVRAYDLVSDSYSSSTSSYAGAALPAGWIDLVAGTGTTSPGVKNIPTSVGFTYSKGGSMLVVLNVPNAVTFTPTATGAAPVTTTSLAVSFTAIGTNQAAPNTLPGWPTAGKYYFSVWGPPAPAIGTVTGVYPVVPQPAWLVGSGASTVQTLMKAYWNVSVINNDGSRGIHNPSFFNSVVASTSAQLKALP
jgi:hypothetical protein